MKTYSITQLKKLSKEQGYKMAALENSEGKRLQTFNTINVKIDTQLQTISNRLSSEIYPDGIYTVLLCRSIHNRQDPDRYQIVKGVLKKEEIKVETPIVLEQKAAEVLTWEGALKMQQEISNLKSEVQTLKFENNLLQSELDNIEENEGLAEGEQKTADLKSGAQTFLSETVPQFLPLLDRFFDMEEKKLNLRQMEIQSKRRPQQAQRKPIVIGSQDHLNIIEHYYNKNDNDKLSAELDKLEKNCPDIYLQVCKKLNIDIEEEEEEEGSANGN